MPQTQTIPAPLRRGVPRGLKKDGPALLSYGFRPFFLLAGLWALVAMCLWMGSFIWGWTPGGDYGALNWHAHEMLFGYAGAVVAGFMLTAIPNWTGRLPVAGRPLLALVVLWLCGRVAMVAPEAIGLWPAAIVDALFFPVLGLVAAREIGAGHNWRNLHVVLGLLALSVANVWFHVSALGGTDTGFAYRLAILVWIMLIALIGGRLAVSFTRNFLARQKSPLLPAPFGRFDRLVLVVTLLALSLWVVSPDWAVTGGTALVAAAFNFLRLRRWQGMRARREPLVLVLHLAYGFIPLGLAAIGLSGFGMIGMISALHLLTVGAIANMTLAVMTRATRGHTGRPLGASWTTTLAYSCLMLAALVRPVVDMAPDLYLPILGASGLFWILAYALFILEHGPMLIGPSSRS
jgi:uncharacterized protein involved in response to NO